MVKFGRNLPSFGSIEINALDFGRRWGWGRRGSNRHGRGRRRASVARQGRTWLVVVGKLDAILLLGVLLGSGGGGRGTAVAGAFVLVFGNRLPAAVALQADVALVARQVFGLDDLLKKRVKIFMTLSRSCVAERSTESNIPPLCVGVWLRLWYGRYTFGRCTIQPVCAFYSQLVDFLEANLQLMFY